MFQKLDPFSFGIGLLVMFLLVFSLGAAVNNTDDPRYSTSPVMGGIGLQIVDHNANRLYHYKREKEKDGASYVLYETIDLSLTGKKRIPAQVDLEDESDEKSEK